MHGRISNLLRILLSLSVVGLAAGCEVGGEFPVGEDAGTSSSSSGTGGSDPGPCGIDCSQIETPQCAIAVCNTGQVIGPLNTCIVIPAPKGTACDDGKFCTTNDTCDAGTCVGGSTNHCGIVPSPCSSVICYEDAKSCDVTPVNDGTACTPTDLCQKKGVCKIGECIGEPRDCSFSPESECNTVACDPATGECVGKPDSAKDNTPCVLTGDLCNVNRRCSAGQCVGGAPMDCSALDVGCQRGECNPANGLCNPRPAPVGTACTEGIVECQVGTCDVKGECLPSLAADGSDCNDYNACTAADKCMAGSCEAGDPVTSCSTYLHDGFESCQSGWTFGGDWECGTPENVGPPAAYIGTSCIGTQIDDLYHVNQLFSSAVADSPPINLAGATTPMLSFWAWDHTEGGTFDGWNLKISTNGGQSFTQVTTVTPAYNLSLVGQPAWGGNHSAKGWQNYSADLTAYAGQSVILRFAFRSDAATVFPGVYIDEVVVAEPLQIPLYITTTSPLTDVYAGMSYSTQITKIGGTSGSVWTLKGSGQNADWLTIDPTTGVLYGTPSAAEAGPVTVTVHVEEPSLPSNYAEKTFIFTVKPNAYYTSFEGTCPDGWTLTGDWQCGVPTNVGPEAAYDGTQCIATQIAGPYSSSQTWAGTTATSPDIDLTGVASPKLTFRMWIDTEGSQYDGVNLKISTDGGMSYSVVNSVLPAYPLTIAGQPAWGGHHAGLGWQLVQADLSAYAGQIVRLQFGFQSDSSGNYPGAYIDDIFIE
ncbi:choice-of-anchor J domain-containing protein [Polyangium jinanense]|uniref:Immune inhibitor A n=1 Tax=Polyangium jinanense TaxID=2829994 RepID=A0A9X4ASV1_9BACT|nr:choice-of-anchor J domain-containing protein [Polyangium jinanense]MDC3955214.1 immune inhibitor A [Polyangium jinanense]MDC3981515.1 immune inhibitor A [Polyangium jinanense]